MTKYNLTALNDRVSNVDLVTFFNSNHKADTAQLWKTWQAPADNHVLDESKMGDVLKFLDIIDRCLRDTTKYHVQYSHSTSFSWNVPKDENDKPLNAQQASIVWNGFTRKPVDDAVGRLFDDLEKAQKTAAMENLFGDGPQMLRATIAPPAQGGNGITASMELARQP